MNKQEAEIKKPINRRAHLISEYDMESELTRMLAECSEKSEPTKAMWVGEEAFSWICIFMDRFALRYHNKCTKIMVSLSDERTSKKVDFSEIVAQFGKLLQNVIRKNDVITQNRPNCFFMLLPELSEEDLYIVIDRIEEAWSKTRYGKKVKLNWY